MAHKPWTTADQQRVSELKPLALAEYCRQPGEKRHSRPAAQEYNVLCSKRLKRGKGRPWSVPVEEGKLVEAREAKPPPSRFGHQRCHPLRPSVSIVASSHVPSGITPVPVLISLDVDNGLS